MIWKSLSLDGGLNSPFYDKPPIACLHQHPLFPVPYPLFPVPCSLFPIPCSLSPVPCSLFPIPCSLFPIPCSLFPIPCSLFPVKLKPILAEWETDYRKNHNDLKLLKFPKHNCLGQSKSGDNPVIFAVLCCNCRQPHPRYYQ